MLIPREVDDRPELTLWLDGVYVVSAFRRQGLGWVAIERREHRGEVVTVMSKQLAAQKALP